MTDEVCPRCGNKQAVPIVRDDRPIGEIALEAAEFTKMAIAEATGEMVEVSECLNGVLVLDRHVSCDVLTKARRLVAAKYGWRMEDELEEAQDAMDT